MNNAILEAYLRLGVLGLIAVVFVAQAMTNNKKILEMLTNIYNNMVNNYLEPGYYEKMLIYKYKNIAKNLAIVVGEYILRNNIVDRYETINNELDEYVKEEKIKFKYSFKNLSNDNKYNKVCDFLDKKIDNTFLLIMDELINLKKEHTIEESKIVTRNIILICKKFESDLVAFAREL